LEQPSHVTINELVITPTWNSAYNRVPGPLPPATLAPAGATRNANVSQDVVAGPDRPA
jgi:hypothetical protein